MSTQKRHHRAPVVPILLGILMLVSFLTFAVPTGIRLYRERQRLAAVEDYSDLAANMSESERAAERALCVNYNTALRLAGIGADCDTDILGTYEDRLSDVLCVLEVPSIGLKIPVYHDATDASLQKGAGHMPQSSLPVGGLGAHAVLSAHNGDPYSESFGRLEELALGDYFSVTVLGDTLWYQVDRIDTVEPSDTDWLTFDETEDRVTLLTCIPKGVNSHRLLVSGVHCDAPADAQEDSSQTTKTAWMAVALSVLGAGVIAFAVRRKKKTES